MKSVTIVALYFDPSIGSILREALELEGYAVVVATREAEEALRAIGESGGLCILLTDNYVVSPVAREALSRLAAAPALRSRVRVIGMSAYHPQSVPAGLVDGYMGLPFTMETLLETIEAHSGGGSAHTLD